MKSHQDEVDWLFRNAEDRDARIRVNPVTGEQFLSGKNAIRYQKENAVRALEARDWFEAQRPPDSWKLPLNHCERQTYLAAVTFGGGGIGRVVLEFALSLARRDYRFEDHPLFQEFAQGVMASGVLPHRISEDPELLRRYPPKSLPGLHVGLVLDPVE